MNYTKIFLGLTLVSTLIWSDPTQNQTVLRFHQSTLNTFFQSLGPITGSSDIQLAGNDRRLTWILTNPNINILKDKILFTANVSAKTDNGLHYSSIAKGEAKLSYDPTQNIITATVKKATFDIGFSLMGSKFSIMDMDITKYTQSQTLNFPVPQPPTMSITIKMPDQTTKNIRITIKNHDLKTEPEFIIIHTIWNFK